jgi:hypothetical protein
VHVCLVLRAKEGFVHGLSFRIDRTTAMQKAASEWPRAATGGAPGPHRRSHVC